MTAAGGLMDGAGRCRELWRNRAAQAEAHGIPALAGCAKESRAPLRVARVAACQVPAPRPFIS